MCVFLQDGCLKKTELFQVFTVKLLTQYQDIILNYETFPYYRDVLHPCYRIL